MSLAPADEATTNDESAVHDSRIKPPNYLNLPQVVNFYTCMHIRIQA